MPATLDLLAVRRFTEDLNDRVRQCENGEGMICSTLNERINHYAHLCRELWKYINEWARRVFTGCIAFDLEVESLLKAEAQHLLDYSKDVAAYGRVMNGQCYDLQGLNALHFHVAAFDYLLENWVSPRLAVSPTPRVKLSDAAEQQILENLDKLPALPRDWQPADPEQLAFFRKRRAK